MKRLAVFAMLMCIAQPSFAEDFSCRGGTKAACLDYGDTVCSSAGMCVNSNAACFDKYQCDYDGFTCKSNVTACEADYEKLRKAGKELSAQYDTLAADFTKLRDASKDLSDAYDDAQRCLNYATTLEEAKACIR